MKIASRPPRALPADIVEVTRRGRAWIETHIEALLKRARGTSPSARPLTPAELRDVLASFAQQPELVRTSIYSQLTAIRGGLPRKGEFASFKELVAQIRRAHHLRELGHDPDADPAPGRDA